MSLNVSTEVRTIGPNDTAREAAGCMEKWHVGFLIVVEEGQPIGVITDRDVALRTLCSRQNPGECLVETLMSKPVVTLEETRLSEASRIMRKQILRKLPIVDAQGHLKGVVTADDLIQDLGQSIQDLAAAVRTELSNEAIPGEACSSVFGKE